jgi:hypothetical protein
MSIGKLGPMPHVKVMIQEPVGLKLAQSAEQISPSVITQGT